MCDSDKSKEFIKEGFLYEDLREEYERGDIRTDLLFLIQISRLLNEQVG